MYLSQMEHCQEAIPLLSEHVLQSTRLLLFPSDFAGLILGLECEAFRLRTLVPKSRHDRFRQRERSSHRSKRFVPSLAHSGFSVIRTRRLPSSNHPYTALVSV